MKQFRIEVGVDVGMGLSERKPQPQQPNTDRTELYNRWLPWVFLLAFIASIVILRLTQ